MSQRKEGGRKHDSAGAREALSIASNDQASHESLASSVTMEAVRRYVEAERDHGRRVFLWISAVFLLVALAVLATFVSIGIFILRNARKATTIADSIRVETESYASELANASRRVAGIETKQAEVLDAVQKQEAERAQKNRLLRSDLERFSRWIGENNARESKSLAALESRLRELEQAVTKTVSQAKTEMGTVGTQQSDALAAVAGVKQEEIGLSVPDATAENAQPAERSAAADIEVSAESESPDDSGRPSLSDTSARAPVEPAPPAETTAGSSLEAVIPPTSDGAQREISVVTFPNGDRYEGEFKDGLLHGWGVYYYANGDKYEGEFKTDVKHGKGAFTYHSGDKHIGEFKDGVKHGRGSFIFHNGDRYAGEFRDDMINGKGTMLYKKGNKYTGDFASGLKHGNGTLIFSNGDKFEGEFKDDLRHGRGVYLWADGAKYIGDFRQSRMHGEGRYVYPGGEEYVGSFREGKKHGEGVSVYPDGRKFKGLWEDDSLKKVIGD